MGAFYLARIQQIYKREYQKRIVFVTHGHKQSNKGKQNVILY